MMLSERVPEQDLPSDPVDQDNEKKRPLPNPEGGKEDAKKRRSRWNEESAFGPPASSVSVAAQVAEASAKAAAARAAIAGGTLDAARAALERVRQLGILDGTWKAGTGLGPASLSIAKIQQVQAQQNFIRQQQQAQIAFEETRRALLLPQGATGFSDAVVATPEKPVAFDRLGRPLDSEGNVIEAKKPLAHSSFKVNQNVMKQQRYAEVAATTKAASMGGSRAHKWFDSSIKQRDKMKRNSLKFVKEGFYLKKEAEIAERERRARERAEAETIVKEKEVEKKIESKVMMTDEEIRSQKRRERRERRALQSKEDLEKHGAKPLGLRAEELIPEIEPWDAPLLYRLDMPAAGKFSPGHDKIKPTWDLREHKIGALVEHPVPVPPAKDEETATTEKVYLTTAERRKLRRRKRQEKEREKQDKIRIGLMPPPPPKVKISNLMRVLGDEAVADPSRLEREVRAQMDERVKKHEARNRARMLTAEQRKTKTTLHWQQAQGDNSQVHTLIFSLHKDFADRKIIFKIDRNAEQLHLTGVGILCKGERNFIVVEGGLRAIRRFKRLMLRRIKWNEVGAALARERSEAAAAGGTEEPPIESFDPVDDDEDEAADDDEETYGGGGAEGPARDDAELNAMQTRVKSKWFPRLVWQGTADNRMFKKWRLHTVRSEGEARKILQGRAAMQYYEMVERFRDITDDVVQGFAL